MANLPRPSLEELEEYLKNYDEQASAAPQAEPTERIRVTPEPVKPAFTAVEPPVEPVKAEPAPVEPAPEAEVSPAASAPAPAEPVCEVSAPADKPKKVKRKKSPLLVVWNVISTLLVIAVILLAIALVGVRLIGYTPYAVLSPSMTPEFVPGDLIYVKEVSLDQISEGDVISFVANEDDTIVTHRVVEVDREGRKFYTQGDANENRDGNPVLYENVLGVVQFSLPKLGYVSSYVSSESGRYVAIVIVLVLVLLWILPELFRPEEKKQKIEDQKGI